jgi:hypothetical protein
MPTQIEHDPPLTVDTVLVASRDQVSCEVSGETVVLTLTRGQYHGLNEVASRIWNLFNAPRAIAEVCAALQNEYEVDAERCTSETISLCEVLMSWGLLDRVDERYRAGEALSET